MDGNGFFDLTNQDNDIDRLSIKSTGHFNCCLADAETGEVFKGFILANSQRGNRKTVCDIDFHRSSIDDRYQPRLTFRRVNQEFIDVASPASSRHIRMPFAGGEDGYREFWKMIFFLYRFKETIDFGDFDGAYQVISSNQLKDYMNNSANKDKIGRIADEIGIDVSEILRARSTISLLKSYRTKLKEFIDNDSTETDVQNWLDEDGHKYRQQRCMIFGLEYIDFSREGSVNSKNFDVLTRVGSKHIDHVLIELKSPGDDIFKITRSDTINNQTSTYQIHDHLARAIPQILEYKSALESKEPGDAELEKLGIQGKAYIGKCIIVIGKHREDTRWLQNRKNLVRSLGATLDIWTYSELLEKLSSTIENLERIKEDEQVSIDEFNF